MTPGTIRVLYVDDEPDLLDLGKVFLELTGGFAVTPINSAVAALDLLANEQFDAIISDYQMPEMDGISFLSHLRGHGDETPFIIFTGRGREEVVIEALNEGADFYLQKGGDTRAQFTELAHKIHHAFSRRNAIRALKKSERDYRHLIEHAKEAIYVVQDDLLRMANPALAEMTGYSEDELLLLPFTTFIHPDDRAFVADRYQRRIRGEDVPSRYTFRLYRKDGTVRWVELSVVVILWDDRPAVLVFLTDIHQRKLTEDALREREERYRQFFRTTLDSVFITTPEGGWIDFNDALVEMFGYTCRDEMFQVPVPSVYAHPGEREAFLQRVVREGYVKECPLLFRKRDGTTFDALITIVPLKNPDGTIKAFIGTFRDITEQMRAERALQESEERYRLFFKTIRDCVFITTPAGEWIDCNDALVETLGFTSREEIMTVPVAAVYANPGERDAFIRRVEQEGYVREQPIRFRRRDGTSLDALITIVPVKKPDGSVRAFIGTVRDITEQKRVEAALVASETRYRQIFESFEDLYYQTDMNGIITILSPSLNRLTGWQPEELIGKPATVLYVNPQDRAPLLEEIAARGHVRDYEILLTMRDGTKTPASLSANRIYNSDGTAAGVAGILRDHTRRKQAEEALRESEVRFRSLIETSPDMIWEIDLQGNFRYISPTITAIMGYQPEDLLGRPIALLVREEARQHIMQELSEHIATPGPIQPIEVPARHRDGHDLVVEVRPTRVSAPDGSLKGLYGVARDITERRRAEDALRLANHRLGLLTSITVHDIRNQLLALTAYIDLAKRHLRDPATLAGFLARQEEITDIMAEQIAFTREYQNVGAQEPQWVDLEGILSQQQGSAPVVLGMEVRGIQLYADPMLEKVFFNLLDNSLRHGGHVTKVRISSGRQGGDLVIIWEDNGAGIPVEEKESIFTRGFGKNTGLGMFLVREILSLTGITISETGVHGYGARFEIRVPSGKWRVNGGER